MKYGIVLLSAIKNGRCFHVFEKKLKVRILVMHLVDKVKMPEAGTITLVCETSASGHDDNNVIVWPGGDRQRYIRVDLLVAILVRINRAQV